MADVMIDLELKIDNFYGSAPTIVTTASTIVPAPPEDRDARDDWEWDYIYPHTGTGRTEGDSAYFVTVVGSSRPDLIPLGTEYEFGT